MLYESNSDLLRRNWRANLYRMDWGTIAAGTPGGGWQPDKNIDQECYVNPDCNASAWAPTYCDDNYPCNPEHLPRYFGALVLEGDGPWAEVLASSLESNWVSPASLPCPPASQVS